jgi:ribonuclease BN (tRNA processing enzyme)
MAGEAEDGMRLTRRAVLSAPSALALGGAAPTPAPARSRLILLGTAGGPTPKPGRAAPANAIVIGGDVYIIDCGNGVGRQLALAGLKLPAIRAAFITHHHSDHNADFGTLLLLAWAAGLSRPTPIYGPPPLVEMTRAFQTVNRVDIETREVDEGRVPFAGIMQPAEVAAGGPVMSDANVRVSAALVDHPMIKTALAYRFDCPDRSIVFSGDTTESPNLIALAKGADVLVHEVMYLPGVDKLVTADPGAAGLRKHLLASHSTCEQVGRVATAAGVKTLVLTHFVPGGDPPIPDAVWRDAVRPHFKGEIVVGRDLLEL